MVLIKREVYSRSIYHIIFMVDICSGDIQFLSGIDRAHFDSDQSERSILLVIESIPSLEENEI